MSYCTLQDLIDEFTENELIQLTDNTGTGVVDGIVINKAIARADTTIARYLSGRKEISGTVTDLACDIARYYLYASQVTDIVKQRFELAIKTLEQIAAGKIALADTVENAPPVLDLPVMQSSGNVFGRDSY